MQTTWYLLHDRRGCDEDPVAVSGWRRPVWVFEGIGRGGRPFLSDRLSGGLEIAEGEYAGEYRRAGSVYNDRPLYCHPRRPYRIGYSLTRDRWVLGERLEPVSYLDTDGKTPLGDAWLEADALPDADGTASFAPMGTLASGGAAVTVRARWPRTEKSSPGPGIAGVYDSARDGGTLSAVVGAERYVDDAGGDYIRDVALALGGRDDGPEYAGTGGRIRRDGDAWIIGRRGIGVWFEGTGPSPDAPATFAPMRIDPETGAAVPATDVPERVVSFDGHVLGTAPRRAYATEVARWRKTRSRR